MASLGCLGHGSSWEKPLNVIDNSCLITNKYILPNTSFSECRVVIFCDEIAGKIGFSHIHL